jgi:hypothetical protein
MQIAPIAPVKVSFGRFDPESEGDPLVVGAAAARACLGTT